MLSNLPMLINLKNELEMYDDLKQYLKCFNDSKA